MRGTTLLAAVAAGDAAAFDALYNRYRADVYRLVYDMCRQHQTAEDLTQDTFVAALTKAASYRRDVSVKGWLLTIARHKALNHLRDGARTRVPLDAVDEPSCADPYDFESLDLLRELTERQRSVVLLHVVYGLKHKEIAVMLELEPDAVRQTYRRAIAKLNATERTGGYGYETI